MSTSDQNGEQQLTRKQLRELRLTGSTPVITEEEAAAHAAPPSVLPRAAEPAPVAPARTVEEDLDLDEEPLTRREAREQERVRTASVPVLEENGAQAALADVPETAEPETAEAQTDETPADTPIVSSVPAFAAAETEAPEAETEDPEVTPEASETEVVEPEAAEVVPEAEPAEPEAENVEPAAPVPSSKPADQGHGRATVGSAFGRAVGETAPAASIPQLFDDIIDGDHGGSHHTASNAMIFTPAPGSASLSGPVASTGELLITGSYDLPDGLGSRGHAHGTTDGKDVDAVLIDGELPPTSSPTPIAASSAVSTSKPAGEVIRPPAPEKGNKLMLTLAIVAGGLALALATVLVVAFTTNVFG